MTKTTGGPPGGARQWREPPDAPEQPTSLRLTDPAGLATAVPFLVGYHPDDSIVVLGLQGKRLHFTVRADLPPLAADGKPDPAELTEIRGRLVEALSGRDAQSALLVGFGEARRVDPLITQLRNACHQADVRVVEALRVDSGRFWSYLCPDPNCCPTEGTPYDASSHPVSAAAIVAGCVALPNRKAYEGQLDRATGPARAALAAATDRADQRMLALIKQAPSEDAARASAARAGRTAVAEALVRTRSGGRLSDDEVGWLTVLLSITEIRDMALEHIRGTFAMLSQHRSLWLDVLRRAEIDLFPGPATLFAFAAFQCGDTVLARIALEQVLAAEPNYRLASLLTEALDSGVSPAMLMGRPRSTTGRRSARRKSRRSSSGRAESPRG